MTLGHPVAAADPARRSSVSRRPGGLDKRQGANVRTAQEIERDLAKLGVPVRPSDAVQRVLAKLDQ